MLHLHKATCHICQKEQVDVRYLLSPSRFLPLLPDPMCLSCWDQIRSHVNLEESDSTEIKSPRV